MASARTTAVLDPASPDRIRNVALVGPSGAGKTALVAALLARAGVLNRAADLETEQSHDRSVSLSVTPLAHEGTKVNLVDTPGYADFAGEVRAALRAVDAALFVLPANGLSGGLDGELDWASRALWRECAAAGTPRAVVVTKLDHPRADHDAVVAAARAAYGERVLPVFVPSCESLLHLLDDGVEHPARAALIEGVIEESEDEGLMDRYLAGEAIEEKQLVDDLERAMVRGSFFPVIPVCAATGLGLEELLDLVVRGFPSPYEHPSPEVFTPSGVTALDVVCDPTAPLVAEVVKTTSDPYVGRVSIVRVFAGTLHPDQPVHVSGHLAAFFGEESGHLDHDEDERVISPSYPAAGGLAPAQQLIAGDIGALAKLGHAETGDTLSSVDHPVVLRPWDLPDPQLPVAIEAASRSDEDRLSSALTRLAAEDPSLRVERNPETHQVVLWVLGEAHAEVALRHLRERFGVAVEQVELAIPHRATFAASAKGHGRHVKQSGGHGQFAIVDIEVEPLPHGSGFEFVDRVVGGAVPRQYIPSVEKGLAQAMAHGVDSPPLIDLRVTLVDGKAHSVDSSDMAFQTAAGLALRDALSSAGLAQLEPYDEIAVMVPDAMIGEVMSDLSARRGRLLGSDPVPGSAGAGGTGEERTLIRALVPQESLVRYAIDLRAATHGAGSFTRTFAAFEPAV